MHAQAIPARSNAGFQRDVLHVLLLVGFDVFAIFEAFALAFALRGLNSAPMAEAMTENQFALLVVCLSPLWIALFAFAGLYSVKQRRGRPSELGRTAVVVLVGVMILIVVHYFRPGGRMVFPGRAVPLYAVPIGIVFVFASRQIVRLLLRSGNRHGFGLRRVVLVGSGELARRIGSSMASPGGSHQIVAVVDPSDDGDVLAGGVPVLSSLDAALARYAGTIDEVVQADVDLDRTEIARMMSMTTAAGITYRFVPDQYGVYAAASTLTTISGIPVMDVRLTALDGWGAVAKRSFDLVGAALFAIVLSPLFAAIALAIKLTDPSGPVVYRQNRIGRGGVGIRVTKFRSMRWAYCTGPDRPFRTAADAFRALGRDDLIADFERDQKVADDPRVSRVGRFLRRTSLDELPQLLDVFRGSLSLIGPRPITLEELERYGAQRASFLALKPGITGLWQVSGRNDVSYDERVKLDVFYVENWSMKLDLTILAKTTTAVLAKRGAY